MLIYLSQQEPKKNAFTVSVAGVCLSLCACVSVWVCVVCVRACVRVALLLILSLVGGVCGACRSGSWMGSATERDGGKEQLFYIHTLEH